MRAEEAPHGNIRFQSMVENGTVARKSYRKKT